MTLPPKQCLCCGREIVKDQFCVETPDQFAKRYNGSWCRTKCKRNLPKSSPKDRPTLVADPTAWNYERPEGKEQPKEKPVRDAKYLEWVRSLPCLIPGCQYQAEAHHQNERGQGGKGTRADDYRALPLCPFHHTLGGTLQAQGSYHGMGKLTGWKFWKAYGVDVESTIHKMNCLWVESRHL